MDPTKNLEALGNMTQETDANNPGPEQQQAQQEQERQASQAEAGAREWGMVMFTVGGLACMNAPELQQVYTQERCLAWGKSANAVAEKYGWNSPANLPELALLASTFGFAVPTFFVIREKMAELKAGTAKGWFAKVGIWWRARQARRAQPAPADVVNAEAGG